MRCAGCDRDTFFLLEDVVLALGNLRGALAWLDADPPLTPAERRAGIARLGRQVDLLHDRVRRLASARHPPQAVEFRSCRRPAA
ncbi:MAG: hypothetical protein N2422_07865 [Rhodobacteraceae bacterium]|nr:hypothetical protein [Paracoccaceae bacterium]